MGWFMALFYPHYSKYPGNIVTACSVDSILKKKDTLGHLIPQNPLLWVNYNDLTVLPHWNHGQLGKSSPNGRIIQVSEIL